MPSHVYSTLGMWQEAIGSDKAADKRPSLTPPASIRRWPPSLPLERGFSALAAGGASVHFLQKLAHCIELCAEAFPISGLQSLHCLVVAIKRLPCLTCRRVCEGHLLCRA